MRPISSYSILFRPTNDIELVLLPYTIYCLSTYRNLFIYVANYGYLNRLYTSDDYYLLLF